MRREKKSLPAIGLMWAVTALVGCDVRFPHAPRSQTRDFPVEGRPADYFPLSVGDEWEYEISVGAAEPLAFEQVVWPMGKDRYAVQSSRRRFIPLSEGGETKTFRLVLRVKSGANEQGPLEFPVGAELEVVMDDLGIFDDADRVFWAVITAERFMAHLVITYDSSTPGAPADVWGNWGQEDGFSMRLVMFAESPGTTISMGGDDASEDLVFVGIDRRVKGHEGQSLLHFVRNVAEFDAGDGDDGGGLHDPFQEHLWYARNRGLVRLEQQVGGETSMTWTLAEKSRFPGPERRQIRLRQTEVDARELCADSGHVLSSLQVGGHLFRG